MRLTFCRLPAAVFGLGCYCIPLAVSAVTVNVNSSVPISTEVVPQLSTANTALASILTTEQEIATAIAENASKTNAIITQTAQANREQQIFSNQVQRLRKPAGASLCRKVSAVNPPPAWPFRPATRRGPPHPACLPVQGFQKPP